MPNVPIPIDSNEDATSGSHPQEKITSATVANLLSDKGELKQNYINAVIERLSKYKLTPMLKIYIEDVIATFAAHYANGEVTTCSII